MQFVRRVEVEIEVGIENESSEILFEKSKLKLINNQWVVVSVFLFVILKV